MCITKHITVHKNANPIRNSFNFDVHLSFINIWAVCINSCMYDTIFSASKRETNKAIDAKTSEQIITRQSIISIDKITKLIKQVNTLPSFLLCVIFFTFFLFLSEQTSHIHHHPQNDLFPQDM